MVDNLPPSAQRVQNELARMGYDNQIVIMERTTRTCEDAANAVGCQVGQIAKSLIFKGKKSGKSVLVIASGSNMVHETEVKNLIGEKISRADADFVRTKTGFAIGGVPPLGHAEESIIVIDEDIWSYDRIWAAGGTPNAVFPLTPDQLAEMTGGVVGRIKKS